MGCFLLIYSGVKISSVVCSRSVPLTTGKTIASVAVPTIPTVPRTCSPPPTKPFPYRSFMKYLPFTDLHINHLLSILKRHFKVFWFPLFIIASSNVYNSVCKNFKAKNGKKKSGVCYQGLFQSERSNTKIVIFTSFIIIYMRSMSIQKLSLQTYSTDLAI
jgi:hypothetical protein